MLCTVLAAAILLEEKEAALSGRMSAKRCCAKIWPWGKVWVNMLASLIINLEFNICPFFITNLKICLNFRLQDNKIKKLPSFTKIFATCYIQRILIIYANNQEVWAFKKHIKSCLKFFMSKDLFIQRNRIVAKKNCRKSSRVVKYNMKQPGGKPYSFNR